MSINILATEIHENAKAHGWWDAELQNIPEKIALMHSELSEALEEYRNHRALNEIYYAEGSKKPEGFGIELADAMIRIMDTAEFCGINLRAAIETKMAYNKTRPHRHDDKKC